jgi:hypothetical protein
MSQVAERGRNLWIAVVVVLLATLFAHVGIAAEPVEEAPRLLMFSDQLADPLVARVLAELRSQGFEVVTVSAPAARVPDQQIQEMAFAAHAVAAVKISASESAVDLEVTDSATQQVFARRVTVEEDRAVAALRAVEILRTRLINLLALAPRRRPHPTERALSEVNPKPAEPVRPLPLRAAPQNPTFAIAVEAGASQSPGGASVSWHGLLAFRFRSSTGLLLEALGVVPASNSEFKESDGSARLNFAMLGAGVGWRPDIADWWSPDAGLGVVGTLVRVRGMPLNGMTGHSDTSLAAAPYLRIGFGARLVNFLALRADLLAGWVEPRTVVFFADRQVGSWGRPVVLGTTGLEWSWR